MVKVKKKSPQTIVCFGQNHDNVPIALLDAQHSDNRFAKLINLKGDKFGTLCQR